MSTGRVHASAVLIEDPHLDSFVMVRTARTKKSEALMIEFGKRLRKIREDRLLSQRALADGIGIETAQISRYERGVVMPNAETLIELATFLRVSIGKLLTGEEDGASAAGAPIRDISLLERFRDVEKLSRKDREMVINLIDAVISSRQHEEVMQRRPRRTSQR